MNERAAKRTSLRLMITGGGTGGHLFPAIATAEQLCATMPGSEVLFVGTRRKLDRESLARYGFAVTAIHSYGLKGKNIWELLKAAEDIEAGHKIALASMAVGDKVYRYGEPIVEATAAVEPGQWVHVHNTQPIPGDLEE